VYVYTKEWHAFGPCETIVSGLTLIGRAVTRGFVSCRRTPKRTQHLQPLLFAVNCYMINVPFASGNNLPLDGCNACAKPRNSGLVLATQKSRKGFQNYPKGLGLNSRAKLGPNRAWPLPSSKALDVVEILHLHFMLEYNFVQPFRF
jgi:hypothetical protein